MAPKPVFLRQGSTVADVAAWTCSEREPVAQDAPEDIAAALEELDAELAQALLEEIEEQEVAS